MDRMSDEDARPGTGVNPRRAGDVRDRERAPADHDALAPARWTADSVRRLAAGVASGLGLLGLVTLVGGAICWTRFDRLGLPADHAVAALPKHQLVTVGAVSLVGFLIGAGLAVAGAYGVDPHGQATGRMMAYIASLLAAGCVAGALAGLRVSYVLALGGVGVGLGALSLLIARATKTRFLGFGCAIVLCVATFGGFFAFLLNAERPQSQAVALLTPSGGGLAGVFVARDDERVWIGRATPARLVVLPCKGVAALALDRVRTADVYARGEALLRTLRADQRELAGRPAHRPASLC